MSASAVAVQPHLDLSVRRVFAGIVTAPMPQVLVDLLARLGGTGATKRMSATPAMGDGEFKRQLASLIPQLQTYGRRLARDPDLADDLVQETLLKAWSARARFEGDNLRAWTHVILRNIFLTQMRRARFKAEWNEDVADRLLAIQPSQELSVELADVDRGIAELPPAQSQALLLVTSAGMSYEEVAAHCNCAVGTIKSRVARARAALEAMMTGGQLNLPRGIDPEAA